MNILVTGGAGYIGSFMTRRLVDDGHKVIVIDNLERGHQTAIDKRAEFVKGDLLNESLLDRTFSHHSIQTVIHFAGYISVNESMIYPEKYFENNVFGALKLISKMIEYKIDKLIFSSTASVYGNPDLIPIPEDHQTYPTNPYGESKRMVEKILDWYQRIYSLRFVSLRYFNACGASLDGTLGEEHEPETHLIPNAIMSVLTNVELRLYGNDYDTPDGTCIRDYIHVIDLIEAHILALNKLQNDRGGFIYNVGTGRGHSNKEVIDIVKKISGVDFMIKIADRRPGDSKVLIADPAKISKELGFRPKYSDLETIVKTAWKWHRKISNENSK